MKREMQGKGLLRHLCEDGLRADWQKLLMVHYAVLPETLQPLVPFPVDHFEGEAFVTLVFFRQERLRLNRERPRTSLLFRPFSEHHFVNLRTYVRQGDEIGIYFIREWIDSLPARLAGPPFYGLPYRLGKLRQKEDGQGAYQASLRSGPNRLRLEARYRRHAEPPARRDTLPHFLHERYTAFTERRGKAFRFRVTHRPWKMHPARVTLQGHGPDLEILRHGCLVGASFTPGLSDVQMSFPERVEFRAFKTSVPPYPRVRPIRPAGERLQRGFRPTRRGAHGAEPSRSPTL